MEDSTLDPRSSLSPKILKAPRAVLGAVFSDSMELSKAFHAIRYMLGERKREREREKERERERRDRDRYRERVGERERERIRERERE